MNVFRVLIVGMVILGHVSWATADDAQPQTLRGHKKRVSSLAWSTDGATLASAGDDRTIHLWNPEKGEATTVIPSIAREGYGAPVVAF
jgi:WD40 repeat protein